MLFVYQENKCIEPLLTHKVRGEKLTLHPHFQFEFKKRKYFFFVGGSSFIWRVKNPSQKYKNIFLKPGLIRNFIVKKNHIGSAVSDILHIDIKRNKRIIINIIHILEFVIDNL